MATWHDIESILARLYAAEDNGDAEAAAAVIAELDAIAPGRG